MNVLFKRYIYCDLNYYVSYTLKTNKYMPKWRLSKYLPVSDELFFSLIDVLASLFNVEVFLTPAVKKRCIVTTVYSDELNFIAVNEKSSNGELFILKKQVSSYLIF